MKKKRKKKKIIEYRRKREGKTNYRKRLKLLASNKLRLVVRKSIKNITSQLVEYNINGDKVVLGVSSKELEKKFNWKFSKSNTVAAYLTGLLLGVKANKKGIKKAILDLGLNKSVKGSKVYALLRGALDAGLEIPYSKEMLPSDNLVKGENIIKYFNLQKKSDLIFSKYKKYNLNISELPKIVEEIKKKILESK